MAILYSLMIALAATSVWLGRNQSLYDFWFYITNFSRYPMEIYDGPVGTPLRWSFTFVVPVLVVVNVPARLMAKPLTSGVRLARRVRHRGDGRCLAVSRWVFQRALLELSQREQLTANRSRRAVAITSPTTVTIIVRRRGFMSHSRWKICCQVPSTGSPVGNRHADRGPEPRGLQVRMAVAVVPGLLVAIVAAGRDEAVEQLGQILDQSRLELDQCRPRPCCRR